MFEKIRYFCAFFYNFKQLFNNFSTKILFGSIFQQFFNNFGEFSTDTPVRLCALLKIFVQIAQRETENAGG